MKRVHPLIWAALVLSLILLAGTLVIRSLRRETDLWRRTAAQSEDVRVMFHRVESERSALDAAIQRAAPSVSEMAAAYLPGADLGKDAAVVEELPHGFRHQSVSLTFRSLSWNALRGFLEKAETQTPPWRVTRLDIRAGLRDLDGSLRLEALDKAEPLP